MTQIANGTSLTTYNLTDRPDLYEPSRSNAFEFIIPKNHPLIQKLIPQGATTDDIIFENISDVIKISVDESSVPYFELNDISIRRGNSEMHFAGAPSFSTHTLRLNDYVGARTKDILLALQALVYTLGDDLVHLAADYKIDCQLVEYTPDFSQILRTWDMKGCWVKSISEGSHAHSSVDKKGLDVTIVFDRAIPVIQNYV